MAILTYNETFDEYLNHKESLFNQLNEGEKLNFLDSLETTLTEMLGEGKFGASGSNGITFEVDKGNKGGIFKTSTTGTRVEINGAQNLMRIFNSGNVVLQVTQNSNGGIIYWSNSSGQIVGALYGLSDRARWETQNTNGNTNIDFVATAGYQGAIIPTIATLPTINYVDLGSTASEFNNAFFDGTVQTDALRIDQTPTVEVNTASHYATVNFNGTNYKVLLKSV